MGALSVFRDGGPGGWGDVVLRKKLGRAPTFPERLLLSENDCRVGAIRFSESATWNQSGCPQKRCSLNDAYWAIQHMEEGQALPEDMERAILHGSSMDGMRPKVFAALDGREWIVKFPSSRDADCRASAEFLAMHLAHECGIRAPETRLIPLGQGKNALAVERFDRRDGAPLHMMSMGSAMGFRPSQDHKKSYLAMASVLQRISAKPTEDCHELFRRMVLNILISNKDDHLFNQAMIYQGGAWRISPAYDVVAGEGNRRDHALALGVDGAKGTIANAISLCECFALTRERAQETINGMLSVIGGWKRIAAEIGVADKAVRDTEWAISPGLVPEDAGITHAP